MRHKIAHILPALVLVLAIGGPWTILQTVAWVSMALSYSHEAPLVQALEKTFDGKHPCNLCKVVQEGRKDSHKKGLLRLENKIDYWVTSPVEFAILKLPFIQSSPQADPTSTDGDSPPTPPPRLG